MSKGQETIFTEEIVKEEREEVTTNQKTWVTLIDSMPFMQYAGIH